LPIASTHHTTSAASAANNNNNNSNNENMDDDNRINKTSKTSKSLYTERFLENRGWEVFKTIISNSFGGKLMCWF
jgi:hypothetical protein